MSRIEMAGRVALQVIERAGTYLPRGSSGELGGVDKDCR